MPYIKQEKRELYNRHIKEMTKQKLNEAQFTMICYLLDQEDLTGREGSLNYIITQLIRSKKKVLEESIAYNIKGLLNLMYTVRPHYYKFKDLFGLLETIAIELIRRDWATEVNIEFLHGLEDYFLDAYSKYEDSKIKENGDLGDIP